MQLFVLYFRSSIHCNQNFWIHKLYLHGRSLNLHRVYLPASGACASYWVFTVLAISNSSTYQHNINTIMDKSGELENVRRLSYLWKVNIAMGKTSVKCCQSHVMLIVSHNPSKKDLINIC